jgi:C-terminal processing protease CtpA/Prc
MRTSSRMSLRRLLVALVAAVPGYFCHAQSAAQSSVQSATQGELITLPAQSTLGKASPNEPHVKRAVEIVRLMEQLAGNAWEKLSYPGLFTTCTKAAAPRELLAAPQDRMVLGRATLAHMLSLKFQSEQDLEVWFGECVDRVVKGAGPRSRVYTKSAWYQFTRARPYGLGLSFRKIGNEWVIVRPTQRGPAAAAGIEPADVLVSVDGMNTEALKPDELQELLRAEGPTPAVIEWRSAKNSGALRKLEVKRDIVVRDESVPVLDMGDHVYIGLPHFYASTTARTLNGMRKLGSSAQLPKVLDLRGNTGGLLDTAQWLLAAFGRHDGSPAWLPVRYGKTASEAPFDARALLNSPKTLAADQPVPTEAELKSWARGGKLFVLIDWQTGSGATWLAAALRELSGALVIGTLPKLDPPPGIDSLNTLRSSDRLYAVVYEIGKLALPSGKIMLEGTLAPDVLVQERPDPLGREPVSADNWKTDPWFERVKSQLAQLK